MGKIGDLFVHLGLKKDGYTKGIDEAKKEIEGFGVSLGKVKAGALAVWAAIGAAVGKFVQDMITGTNRIGDAWNQATAQMKAGWDVFIQSVSNWDWGNFASRIREATAAAKELELTMDGLYEMTNSVNLQKAMQSDRIAQLQIDMRDQTKSEKERLAAVNEYKSIMEGIYAQTEDYYIGESRSAVAAWIAGTPLAEPLKGLEKDSKEYNQVLDGIIKDFSDFIVQYSNKNKELTNAIRVVTKGLPKMPEEPFFSTEKTRTGYQEQLNQWKRDNENYWEALEYIKTFNKEYGYDAVQFSDIYENLRNDESNGFVIQSLTNLYNAGSAYKRENRRIEGIANSIKSEIQKKNADRDAQIQIMEAQVQALTESVLYDIEQDIYSKFNENFSRMAGEESIRVSSEKIDLGKDLKVDQLKSPMDDFTSSTMDGIDAVTTLGGALANITGLMDEGAASWISYGANIIQTIGQAIPAISALTVAKEAEAQAAGKAAAAEAGSSVAGVPFAGPALAIAAITSVIAAIANIPKFADGGIVGGSSYYGDKILARLNSGELVLNQKQQASLLNKIDRPSQDVNITGRLIASGRDLVYVFNDYNRYKKQ